MEVAANCAELIGRPGGVACAVVPSHRSRSTWLRVELMKMQECPRLEMAAQPLERRHGAVVQVEIKIDPQQRLAKIRRLRLHELG